MAVSPAWKVKVNEHEFLFDQETIAAADVVQQSSTNFNLLLQNRSINAIIKQIDAGGKKISVEINGEIFEVEIKDPLAQMLEAMGFSSTVAKQIKEIKAPMPGLVLDINVMEGQTVKEGEKLLVLGAMKMENIITIPADAVIKKISISKGAAVDKGQVLIELE